MSKQKYPQTASASTTGGVARSTKRQHYSHAKADARKDRKRLEAQLASEKAAQVKTAPLTSEQKGAKVVKNAKAAVAAAH